MATDEETEILQERARQGQTARSADWSLAYVWRISLVAAMGGLLFGDWSDDGFSQTSWFPP